MSMPALDKSSVFLLQALVVWMALCLPGNIVTIVLYNRANSEAAASDKEAADTAAEPEYENATSKDQLRGGGGDNDSNHVSIMSVVHDSCDGANVDGLCLAGAIAELKVDGLWEDVARGASECGGEAGEFCRVVRLLTEAEGQDRTSDSVSIGEKDDVKKDNSSGTTNGSATTYQCHEGLDDYGNFMSGVQFWIEGVALLVVSLFGMVGNVTTIVVLGRIDSNTTFNRLLMSLSLVDTLLLLYYLVDYGVVGTFIRSVGVPEPMWYRVTFPYLLHPFKGFSISSSIFMVVAISAERHRAICSPLTHRPAFWPYAVMVFCVAGALSVPRFLEFELRTDPETNNTDYWTTKLNEDKDYITFSSWWDELIVTGVIPLAALVVFNLRIYLKLRASDRQEYRFVGRRRPQQQTGSPASHGQYAGNQIYGNSSHHVHHVHTAGVSAGHLGGGGGGVGGGCLPRGNLRRNPTAAAPAHPSASASSAARGGGSPKIPVDTEITTETEFVTSSGTDECSFRFRSVMRSGVEASAIEMTTFVEGGDRESSNATTVTDTNVNVAVNDVNGGGSGSDSNGHGQQQQQKANGNGAKNGFHFRLASSFKFKKGSEAATTKNGEAAAAAASSSGSTEPPPPPSHLLLPSEETIAGMNSTATTAAPAVVGYSKVPSNWGVLANGSGGGVVGGKEMIRIPVAPTSVVRQQQQQQAAAQQLQPQQPPRSKPSPPVVRTFSNAAAASSSRIATKGNNSDGGVGGYRTGRSGSMGNEHMIQQQTGNAQHFRKRREKSAMILVSIVLTFLFCHTFRLVIQAYEVTHPSHSTAEHHGFCHEQGRFHVPVAFYVMLSASHLLLVVNSSINVVLYCVVGKSFRAELKSLVRSVCTKCGIRVANDSGQQSYFDENTTVHVFPRSTNS